MSPLTGSMQKASQSSVILVMCSTVVDVKLECKLFFVCLRSKYEIEMSDLALESRRWYDESLGQH